MGARALRRGLARVEGLVGTAAEHPLAFLGTLLAINVGAGAAFTAAGYWLMDDQAAFFRELAPGTWLSFAEILLAAAIAWILHELEARPGRRPYHDFWGLSALLLAAAALVELTQPTVFVSKWLTSDLGVAPPGPFNDLDALFLVGLLSITLLLLIRHARVLLEHRRALLLLAVAGLLGACSQTLDSIAPATRWEFVAEDTLKLVAVAFVVAGYAAALHDMVPGARPSPKAS